MISILSTLTACLSLSHKTNYFIEGHFETTCDSINYYLDINEIEKEEYISSNSINVVKDAALKGKKYFRINFSKSDEDGIVNIDLINLKDENPTTNAIPAHYCDDNGVTIMPYSPNLVSDNQYYCMKYNSSYLYFERIN